MDHLLMVTKNTKLHYSFVTEVTDAQTTLAAQRLAFFQALFDYQIALARLRQAAGQ